MRTNINQLAGINTHPVTIFVFTTLDAAPRVSRRHLAELSWWSVRMCTPDLAFASPPHLNHMSLKLELAFQPRSALELKNAINACYHWYKLLPKAFDLHGPHGPIWAGGVPRLFVIVAVVSCC